MRLLSSNQARSLGGIALILLTAILAHAQLLPVGFEITDSDIVPVNLVANAFRAGHWSAFHFDMHYAGTSLAPIRALFTAAWEALSNDPLKHVTSHTAFTYWINPTLLGAAAAFLVASYSKPLSGLLVGLLVAFSTQFLDTQLQNDTYVAYLILGCLLLGWRARLKNPFVDLTLPRLFALGVVCGFSLYTSRATLMYLVPFFLDWEWARGELRRCLRPEDRIERALLVTAMGLLAFFGYQELFGSNLGLVFGRPLKLDADPNLKYAIGVVAILWAKIRWRDLRSDHLRRAAALGLGALMGFAPEWIHFVRLGLKPGGGTGHPVDFVRSMSAIGALPDNLREILAAGAGWKRNASLLLLVLGCVEFVRRARRDARLQPIVAAALFCLYAYCRYETYTFANARYLLPIIPAVWVAWGCLFDRLFERGRWAAPAFGALLIALHAAHQWDGRVRLVESVAEQRHLREGGAITQIFERAGVSTVLSHDYRWYSHNLTWLSQGRVHFEPPPGPGLREVGSIDRLKELKQVGVLLPVTGGESGQVLGRTHEVFGRTWRLTYLARVGGQTLWMGE